MVDQQKQREGGREVKKGRRKRECAHFWLNPGPKNVEPAGQTRPRSQIRPLDSWTPVPGASEAPCSNERLGENTRRSGIPMKGHFEF